MVYEGKHMSIAEVLQKLWPALIGIHPMYSEHGEQPDISFFFQRTNVSEQYKAVVGEIRQ